MATKKRNKVLIIILGILTSILTIAYFQFDKFVERAMRNRLTTLINQSPDKLYQYQFDRLKINLMNGSLTLSEVGLIPTERALDSVKSEAGNIRSIMAVKVNKIEMNGFEIRQFLKTGELHIDDFLIRKPEFKLFVNSDKEVQSTQKTETFNEILTDQFTVAVLNSFSIMQGTFTLTNVNEETRSLMVDSVNFILKNARADRETIKNFIPFKFSDFNFSSSGIHMDISDDFSIESDKIDFNMTSAFIKIFNFQISPKFNYEAFSRRYNEQKQWFALVVNELHLHHIHLDELYKNGDFSVEKLEVINPNVALYKDKTKPVPAFKLKPLPSTAIRNIPFKIDVDTVLVENALITINEKSGLTSEVSNLTFNQLNAKIFGFTNDSSILSGHPYMTANVTTKVMNVGNVQMNMKFDLNSSSDEFSVTGHLDSLTASVFNEVLVPMMAIEVKTGDLHQMDFQFRSMDTLSTGTLDMEYSNIKIDVLNSELKKTKKQGFMSFAANTVIKSNNVKSHSNYIQGVINTPRVMEKDVFPYLWHSIQSGLVSTLVPMANKKDAKQQQNEVKKELKKEKRDAKEKR